MNMLRLHFKQLGIRVDEKVFAYDPTARTLGIRYKMKQLTRDQGWLFKDVDPKEWEIFCANPMAASKLAYWFERGKILTTTAEMTFMGIWNHTQPQMPLNLSEMPFQQKAA